MYVFTVFFLSIQLYIMYIPILLSFLSFFFLVLEPVINHILYSTRRNLQWLMFLTGVVVTESGLRIYYKLSTVPSSGKIKKNKVKM